MSTLRLNCPMSEWRLPMGALEDASHQAQITAELHFMNRQERARRVRLQFHVAPHYLGVYVWAATPGQLAQARGALYPDEVIVND